MPTFHLFVLFEFLILPLLLSVVAIGIATYASQSAKVPGPEGPTGPEGPEGPEGMMGVTAEFVELYISSPVATTFPDATTWTKVLGTTTYSVQHPLFVHSNNRFTYVGDTRIIVHGFLSYACTTNGNNEILMFAIAKNGVPIVPSTLEQRTGTGSDVISSAVHFICTFDTLGDYVEAYVKHTTWDSGNTALFKHLTFGMMFHPSEYPIEIP